MYVSPSIHAIPSLTVTYIYCGYQAAAWLCTPQTKASRPVGAWQGLTRDFFVSHAAPLAHNVVCIL